MRKIILASTSPRRKALLGLLGIPFTVESSNYKENMKLRLAPVALVKTLSQGKAEAVAKCHKDAIVIAADTIVVLKNKSLGKPKDARDAKRTLKMLSGKTNTVLTGYTVIDTKKKKRISGVVATKVHFRKMTEEEINWYVKTKEPLDKGGSYAIQGRGGLFISKIVGNYSNVVGLPLLAIQKALGKFGVRIW